MDGEVKPGRVGCEREGVVDGAPAEPQLEQVLEPDAKLGRDVVTREGDHGRHRPPHRVAPQEEAHPSLLLHPEERHDGGSELGCGGREQLVLGEAVEERDDRLVVVRARDQVLPLHDRLELSPDERDLARRLGVGLRREEPDQPQLPDDLAPCVDALHADVVHPRLAVDGRLGVRLRHDHERPAEDPLAHRLVELGHGHRLRVAGPGLVREQAQARSRDDPGRRLTVDLRGLVLAVAQVDEVVVGEPAQELDRLVHLVERVARARRLGDLDHPLDPLHHRQEVANGEPQAREAPPKRVLERLEARVVERAVGLEVHDRLAPRRAAGGRHRLDGAVGGPLDPHHGVQHETHLAAEVVQLGRHRIDEERRVLDVDVDDRARRRPAVAVRVGVERAHAKLAGRAAVHERKDAPHLRRELGHAVLGPKRRRGAADVRPHELGQRAGPPSVELGQELVDQRGAALVRLGNSRRLVLDAHER